MKTCSRCLVAKDIDEFKVREAYADGRSTWCRKCEREYGRTHYQRTREKHCAQGRARYQADPDTHLARGRGWHRRSKGRKLQEKYGITLEYYHALLDAQAGRCAICGHQVTADRDLHLDHDHHTGKVRGLLCLTCNMALGGFRDSPQVLTAALEYLETSGQEQFLRELVGAKK